MLMKMMMKLIVGAGPNGVHTQSQRKRQEGAAAVDEGGEMVRDGV